MRLHPEASAAATAAPTAIAILFTAAHAPIPTQKSASTCSSNVELFHF
jgi:hypothetical protein